MSPHKRRSIPRYATSELLEPGRPIGTNRVLDEQPGDFASSGERVLLLQISESRPGYYFASIRRLPN